MDICAWKRLAGVLMLCGVASDLHAQDHVVAWGAGTFVAKPADQNDYGQSIVPYLLTNAVAVAGGWRHSLALNADGSTTGWGDDTLGQYDFSWYTTNIIAIACGRQHSLALQESGLVFAAGDDSYGQTDVPTNLSHVVAIACGFYHSLALKSDGTVVAWGISTNSTGLQTNVNFGQCVVPPDLTNVAAIAGGGWHSLTLSSNGTLRAWGLDTYGQADIPAGLSNVVAISAGAAHSLVLHGDGTVSAWGANTYGQTNVPEGLSNVMAIAAGGWHNLALKADGTVVAWGAGVGTNVAVDCGQTTVPTGLTNAVQIAAGSVHSLVLVSGAAVVPYIPTKATYNGLFADTNDVSAGSAGSFKISTTASGAFSGALQIGGTRYSIAGQIGTNGVATNKPAANGKQFLSVSLFIDPVDTTRISGTVTTNGAPWVAALYGEQAAYDGKWMTAPWQGCYTIVIPGNPDPANMTTPGGDSFGTVSVDTAGNIRLAASLADGTKVTQSAMVTTNGLWPLYAPLYNGQGFLWSWLSFANSSVPQVQSGQLTWIKPQISKSHYYPNGFALQTNVLGSGYARVKSLPMLGITNADLVLSGGGLTNPITIPATNYANGKAKGADKAALTFNLTTGLFSGSVVANGPRPISFSGVALTNGNLATGFFLGTNGQSGRVSFLQR